MRKLLLVTFLSIFLFTSFPVYAATQAELNQQFISLLQQMITLILQKIQVLQAQLAEIQARELTASSVVPLLPTPIPAPAPQPVPVQGQVTPSIHSVNIIPSTTTVKVEWQTNQPATSKIFLEDGSVPPKSFGTSDSSTRHTATITGLNSGTLYTYEIEATTPNTATAARESGVFSTLSIQNQRNILSCNLIRHYTDGYWSFDRGSFLFDSKYEAWELTRKSNGDKVWRVNSLQFGGWIDAYECTERNA